MLRNVFKLKRNQYLCRHDWEKTAIHTIVNEELWQCKKCLVYFIFHRGIWTGYYSRTPGDGWKYERH